MFDFQTSCSKCTALWCIVHGACYGAHVDMPLCQLNRGLWFEWDHRLSQQLWLKNCWVLSSLKRLWEEAVDVLMYLNLWQVQRWFLCFWIFLFLQKIMFCNYLRSQPAAELWGIPRTVPCRCGSLGSGADRVLFSVGLDFHAWDIFLCRDFTDSRISLDDLRCEESWKNGCKMIEWQKDLYDKKLLGEVSQYFEDMWRVYTFESGKHQPGGSGSSSSGR